VETEYFDDPVAAYDRIAPEYSAFSERRKAYLRAVEDLIVSRIREGAGSLLDVGAGDGSRAMRIAAAAAIKRVVLVEPSLGMSQDVPTTAELWRIRAEVLNPDTISERFDVVTCLWNSLGHVVGHECRRRALSNIALLLTPTGKMFLDLNHRYNARSYGLTATSARWLKDALTYDLSHGDVTASWRVGGSCVSTYGHVFTHGEIMRLAQSAGLQLESRIVLDYENGSVRRWSWLGNLLYIFRRSSRMDSSSAPATSRISSCVSSLKNGSAITRSATASLFTKRSASLVAKP
jgi:SAM-dependent methyltransferase